MGERSPIPDYITYTSVYCPDVHAMYLSGPPGTVNNLQVIASTATTLTITWNVSGSIDQFEVTYSYTVSGCLEAGGPFIEIISDGSVRSHTLQDLNENSNYVISVGAFNTTESATMTSDTLTSGEAQVKTQGGTAWCTPQAHMQTSGKDRDV